MAHALHGDIQDNDDDNAATSSKYHAQHNISDSVYNKTMPKTHMNEDTWTWKQRFIYAYRCNAIVPSACTNGMRYSNGSVPAVCPQWSVHEEHCKSSFISSDFMQIFESEIDGHGSQNGGALWDMCRGVVSRTVSGVCGLFSGTKAVAVFGCRCVNFPNLFDRTALSCPPKVWYTVCCTLSHH